MAKLQLYGNYLNPYEAAYNKLKGNPFFREEDWDIFAKRGELNQYVSVLLETDKFDTFDKMNEEYRFDLLDQDKRFAAMANELNGNKKNVDKVRTEYKWDKTTGKEKEVTFEMSDYDYTKHLLYDYKQFELAKISNSVSEQQKKLQPIMQKIGVGIASFAGELVMGATTFMDDMANLLDATAAGLNSLATNGTFDDAFRNEYTDPNYRLFDNLGFKDALIEWESNYSSFRDLDGNYTNLGKILGGIPYSLGQALPSMAISGITSKIGRIAAKIGSKAATALYFTGLGSGNAAEMFNDPRMYSVPTAQIVLNAAMKTTAEFLVMKGMNKVFGASTLDKLVFGQKASVSVGKITGKSALKKIGKDALHEGLEETLQEFSGYLIDGFFEIGNENFGQMSQWNLSTMLDAFVLGSISSIGSSSVSMITSKRVDVGKDKKLSKASSWVYNNNLSAMMSDYDNVVNNKKLTNEQKQNAIGQIYASFRTLTSVFAEFGEERVAAAAEMLSKVFAHKSLYRDKSEKTNKLLKDAANSIMSEAINLSKNNLSEMAKLELVDEIMDACMTEVESKVTRDSLNDKENEQIRIEAEKIFDSDKSIKNIVYTKDGSNVVRHYDTLYIPIEYARNSKGDVIIKNVAEKTIVNAILKNDKLKPFVEKIKSIFSRLNSDKKITNKNAIYELLFNQTFYKVALYSSDKDVYKVLSELISISKAASKNNVSDAIFVETINVIINNIKETAIEYLTTQQVALYNDLDFLSNEDKAYIDKKRFSMDLANKVLSGKKLSKQDIDALEVKINSMPAEQEQKDKIRSGILDSSKDVRLSAIQFLNTAYENVFLSEFDGKTYFRTGSVGNNIGNEFLKQEGITISDVNESNFKSLNESFREFTSNKYELSYFLGSLSVTELNYSEDSYKSSRENRDDILTGTEIDGKKRTLSVPSTESKKFLNDILNKELDEVDASYLKLTDIINDPSTLNNELQNDITKKYGNLTANSVFKYLREYFVKKYKTTSISVTENGEYIFVDAKPMLQFLKDEHVDLVPYVGKKTKVSQILNSELAKQTTFIIQGNENYYDEVNNVIHIAVSTDKDYLRFALLHELQHAIQVQNKLSGGLSSSWLSKSGLTKKQTLQLINDVKVNRPDLFTTKASEKYETALSIVQQFVYDISNESQAMGLDTDTDLVDFAPAVIKRSPAGTKITMPWGTAYDLTKVSGKANLFITDDNKNRYLEILNQLDEYSVDYDKNIARKGFILPTGKVIFFKDGNTHPSIISAVIKKSDDNLAATAVMNDAIQITTDYGAANKPKRFNLDGDSNTYTIRMLKHANANQRSAVEKFIDKALSDGKTVNIGDAHVDMEPVSSEDFEFANGSDIIKEYNKVATSERLNKGVASTSNFTQRTKGENFQLADNFTKSSYKGNFSIYNQSGIIMTDGYVGWSIDNLDTNESLITDKFGINAIYNYYDMQVKIVTDVYTLSTSVILPAYVSNAQMDAIKRVVKEIKSSKIKTIEIIPGTTVTTPALTLFTDSDTDYDSKLDKLFTSISSNFTNDKLYVSRYGKDDMSLEKSKKPVEKRYVSNKDAAETNLKYYIKANVPIQLSQDTQEFVISSDLDRLDKRLAKEIKRGNLTKQDVFNFLRKANNVDKYTFNQINKAFFKNDNIKTFEQLSYLVNRDTASFYALRAALKEINAEHLIYEQMSHQKYVSVIKQLESMPAIKKKYEQIMLRYETYQGKAIDIDFDSLKIAFMRDFDGSIDSAGRIAAIAKGLAINGWNKKSKNETSADANIKQNNSKSEEGNATVLDFIADDSQQDVLEAILSDDKEVMRTAILDELLQEEYKLIDKSKATKSQVYKIINDVKAKIESMTDDEIDQAYLNIRVAEAGNVDLTYEQVIEKSKRLRPRANIAANLKRLAATVKSNLSDKEFKKLPPEYANMFDNKRRLKKSVYEGLNRIKLLEVEDTLRDLAKSARLGVFKNNDTIAIQKKLLATEKKLARERKSRLKAETKISKQTVTIGDHEFNIDSNIAMPQPLQAILETTFDNFRDTKVKYLTEDDEKHMEMNLKSFMSKNALRLNALKQSDIDDIINFYSSAIMLASNESSVKRFNAYKLYMLGFIVEQSRNGVYLLSAEQSNNVNALLDTAASNAGTELAVFRSILPKLNPNKIIVQSLARTAGIELASSDLDQLDAALRTGKTDMIDAAIADLEHKIYDLHKGRKKTITKKLWQFQRMMMLSSPGTWVRNISSNVIVNIGNNAGEIIGKATLGIIGKFKKFKRKAGQYTLIGTKVTQSQVDFIKANLLDNGYLNKIRDGLNKYDVRKERDTGVESILELISRSLVSRVTQRTQFDTKFLDNASTFLFKMLSDDKWINKKTLSYFGKMLVEDNTDLSKGLTYEVMNMFAEAYSLAAYDYMHRTNFFNKIEEAIQNFGGDNVMFLYKQLLPFASASWNWFKEGLNYTPLGLIKAIFDFAKLDRTIAKLDNDRIKGYNKVSSRFAQYLVTRNIGKGVIGSIAMGVGILLGALGIAGIDDEDDKIKLRVGDVKVDISNVFGTAGIFLGIALTNPTKGSFEDGINYVADVLFQDSLFGDFYNMFRYEQSVGEWFVSQPSEMLATFVPNALKALTKLTYNHKVNYSKGILGGFERFAVQSIPFIAHALPKRVDPYSGETQSKYSIPFIIELINTMSPIKISHHKVSDDEKEAINNGVTKSELSGKYDDIGALSAADVNKLNKFYGELNKESFGKLYGNKTTYKIKDDSTGKYVELTYSGMTETQKKRIIERVMSDNAQYSKINVWIGNGGTYYADSNMFTELRKLGIKNNLYKATENKKGFVSP